MLILNRRVGETICIGDDVRVTVYDKLRYHVTMGVIAPPSAQLFYGEAPGDPA
jgi:carbon storage regulator CsrA